MIRHIVLFTAREERHQQTILEGLSLLKNTPDCLHLEIGTRTIHDPVSDISPDFIVYGEFESDEQLAAFKNHALYQAAIDIVRPLRDKRIAADFESPVTPIATLPLTKGS